VKTNVNDFFESQLFWLELGKNGMVEGWKDGIVEGWNSGMVEERN
jgi:hypothetical protein